MGSKLYSKLIEYSKSDYYGFHMPGHKRNSNIINFENPYNWDITEITGFDNLHNPEGIIKEEMDKAQRFYNSVKTFFLVNGSSCGILAAISSVAGYGEKIIVGRNCHKSVYNAVELLNLKVDYIYPEMISEVDIFGHYNVKDVTDIIIKNKEAKAIVLTSPTYEGIVSDIEKICEEAHKYGIAVIVDSAHGAHFYLSDRFPKSALKKGADIVIESLHKTLPALTQTAVLHYNSRIIELAKVEKYLQVYQTSSPSYVLMSSISECIELISNSKIQYGKQLADKIDRFYSKMCNLKNIVFLKEMQDKFFDYDISKIVIIIKDNLITGLELKNILESKYHLEMEMAAGNYVLAMTSIFDTEEGFERLIKALSEIDDKLDCNSYETAYGFNTDNKKIYSLRNEKVCEICEANTVNDINVSKNYVYLYPPGIPLVVPGEIVNQELNKLIDEYEKQGYTVIR